MTHDNFSGPFGSYPHGSLGAVLNAACEFERVPLTKVERLQLGAAPSEFGQRLGTLWDRGKVVANYAWFDDIRQPLFRWTDPDYREFNDHRMVVAPGGAKRVEFRPTLCVHETPALEVFGEIATPELYDFLLGMFTNLMTDPRYRIQKDAGAFFQGGHGRPDDGWFLIEFWRHAGAKPFIDYVNENYRPA